MINKTARTVCLGGLVVTLALGISSCAQVQVKSTPTGTNSTSSGTAVIKNCGKDLTVPKGTNRIFVNDGGMIAMVLALDAEKNILAITNQDSDLPVLKRHYGNGVEKTKNYGRGLPTLEKFIEINPAVVIAGWNYGYKEGGVTPKVLKQKGIVGYVLTESCLRGENKDDRGIVPPWDALKEDLTNIGVIAGKEDKAKKLNEDIENRLKRLKDAPQAKKKPNILLFDSGTKNVFTAGKYGGPQAIIDAAGGRNIAEDMPKNWSRISWEKIAQVKPDFIAFNNYGKQTFAQKIQVLENNPITKDLPAVKEKRYINLPYAMWVSSPLNIDAAEQLRYKLEEVKLVPHSNLPKPKFDDHVK